MNKIKEKYEKLLEVLGQFGGIKKLTPQTLYKSGMYSENVNKMYFKKFEKFYKVYLDEKYNTKVYQVKKNILILHRLEGFIRKSLILPIYPIIIIVELYKYLKSLPRRKKGLKKIK